jgi:hypothetical protein
MKLCIFGQDELDVVQLQLLFDNEQFDLFSPNAKYISSPVFSMFKYCFELSKPDYEYLEINQFDRIQIVSLRHQLLTHLTRIMAIYSAENMEKFALRNIYGIEFLNALKNYYPDWILSWEKIRDKLVAINTELLEMVDLCIDDDKVLWIKGF